VDYPALKSFIRKSAAIRWMPVIIVGLLLIVALNLLYQETPVLRPSSLYGGMLIYLNLFILIVLVSAILTNLIRLIYQWHTRQTGSRFTIRIMSGFLVLSLLPVGVISYFSMNFIGKSIGFQLDERIGDALDDSVELSRFSLAVRSQIYLDALKDLANKLGGPEWGSGVMNEFDRHDMINMIEEWRADYNAYEVLLMNLEAQRFEVSSIVNEETVAPLSTVSGLRRNMRGKKEYSQIEPIGDDSGLFARVAVKLIYGPDQRAGILTAMLPLSEYERTLANSVHSARQEFKNLEWHKHNLKRVFMYTLFVIAVMSVLFSLWAAFIFSRRLTQPVRDLVEGTLAVASGDLQKKLPVSERDDFSLVASSFNTMTKRLSNVQQEREYARRQLQQEHDYLYVVLEHLSSGVVTLDENLIVRRVNTAANQILGYALDERLGQPLQEAWQEESDLEPFLQVLQPWLAHPQQDWQAEVSLSSDQGRKVLVCRGAGLPDDAMQHKGYVLVFEDVTDVVQAEHDAAWGEVARRLAHEIKNPLTPIQLSAERLSRKLSKVLDEESTDFLNRMTGTIIHQVDTLKSMVNAFSDYAKAPVLVLRPTQLNELAFEVTDLYLDNPQNVRLQLELGDIPSLPLDTHRIRQLLINLLKNALEAIGDSRQDGCIILKTEAHMALSQPEVILSLQDNGPGIPSDMLPHLFEPYVTSKHKGTGLGLAIVKKIVEEHASTLSARNLTPQGAVISIRFPLKNNHDMQVKDNGSSAANIVATSREEVE